PAPAPLPLPPVRAGCRAPGPARALRRRRGPPGHAGPCPGRGQPARHLFPASRPAPGGLRTARRARAAGPFHGPEAPAAAVTATPVPAGSAGYNPAGNTPRREKRARPAAEGATPVIAQATVPPAGKTLERPARPAPKGHGPRPKTLRQKDRGAPACGTHAPCPART